MDDPIWDYKNCCRQLSILPIDVTFLGSGDSVDYAGFVYRGIDHAASIYEIHYGPWHETTRDKC